MDHLRLQGLPRVGGSVVCNGKLFRRGPQLRLANPSVAEEFPLDDREEDEGQGLHEEADADDQERAEEDAFPRPRQRDIRAPPAIQIAGVHFTLLRETAGSRPVPGADSS